VPTVQDGAGPGCDHGSKCLRRVYGNIFAGDEIKKERSQEKAKLTGK
jgi:hypothetical protein